MHIGEKEDEARYELFRLVRNDVTLKAPQSQMRNEALLNAKLHV